jgi:hypothetical protein
VKIGKSKQLAKRLGDLERMNGSPIVLLAEVRGYTAVERFLHRKFAKARAHGEWFAYTDAIRSLVTAAAANRNVTLDWCARAVKEDEAKPTPYMPELDLDPDPIGDEADILSRWRAAGGYEVEDPIDIDYGSLDSWERYRLDGEGAWRSGTKLCFYQYVGIVRVATQLVEIADRTERQLAFIHAAYLDRGDTPSLRGRYMDCLQGRLGARIDLGQARHSLPLDVHRCNKCNRWSLASAGSSGEWLTRLAHMTRIKAGLHLVRILNKP